MRYTPLVIALLVTGFAPVLFAQNPVTAVVIMEGVTWEHVERGEVGALYVLARHGAVGLMSIGRAKDRREAFAVTLQTGKRMVRAVPEQMRKRRSELPWLTEQLAEQGVNVKLHFVPPMENLQRLLPQPPPSASSPARVHIWWLRGDLSAMSIGIERAIGTLNPERDRVLLVGLPLSGEQLAPVIMGGGGLPTGVLLSATTRTDGLVSDVDIASTLRQWYGIPLQTGEHPMHVLTEGDAFGRVRSLAQRCRWNSQGLIPVGILQVAGGLLAVLTALRAIRARTVPIRTKLLLSVAIGMLLSLPAGTVLAPYLPASLFAQYVANILLSAAGLSLLAHWGAWDAPFCAYVRACALSVLVIVADVMGGQHGVKSSMYSAYALSGIRFYGVGNELMGMLLGCALAWGLYGLPPLCRGMLWASVALVLAVPAWGANIGGLLASVVGLGCAWEGDHIRGKHLWSRCARWLVAGLLAAVAVAWLDSLSASPSHAGEVWLRWQREGWEAVADTLSSKSLLMVRVLLSPFAWGALVAIGVALWKMRRSGLLTTLWKGGKPDYLPWLACMVAAFVFNDSGLVPAAAILGIAVGATLACRLQEVQSGSSR